MDWKTDGRVDSTGMDNLIAKLSPPPDTFLVELKTKGAYKRGTVLSLESNGTYEVLGAGKGKASCILADATAEEDDIAVAYRSGHFNRNALICAEKTTENDGESVTTEHELTATEENDLRLAGIFLSDMV